MATPTERLLSTPIEKILARRPALLPLACFFILLVSNFLLSYFSLPLSLKLWVFIFGIFFPSALALWGGGKKPKGSPSEVLPAPSLWIWMALALAAVFLRFFRLTTLFSWPTVDEGVFGYFATLLEEKWTWQLVHGYAQEPVLYTWGQFLFFKLWGNSPASLWLFPALCSALCVPPAYLAARAIFGRSTGFFAACWMALSFWPLYMGRFSIQSILMALWECLVFFVLAGFLKAPPGRSSTARWALLAVLTGAGFYIYLAWPLVAAAVLAVLFFNPREDWTRRLKTALLFFSVNLVAILPLALAFRGDYRGYFGHLWAANAAMHWDSRLFLPMAYGTELFWGKNNVAFSCGPLWGGLLNPFLSSLALTGWVALWREKSKAAGLWFSGAFLLFFIPAVLTNNLEMMRLTALLPLLVGLAALGTRYLLGFLPVPRRAPLFILVLLASLSLDVRHLFFVQPAYGAVNPSYYGIHKTPEFGQAYSLLKPLADAQGPGIILLNFLPDPYDQTLFSVVYGFNCASNSRLDPSGASWAAVLANIHEQPYLKKLFPGGRWTWLSEGMGRPDGGLILEITPVTAANRGILMKWLAADRSLGELTRLVMELGVDPDQSAMFGVLDKTYPLVKGDRLLESRYWRIHALHQAAAGQPGQAAADEEKAVTLGYPMAHLENEWGCLLFQEGRKAMAKEAFKRALILKPNCTNAAANLANLPTQ